MILMLLYLLVDMETEFPVALGLPVCLGTRIGNLICTQLDIECPRITAVTINWRECAVLTFHVCLGCFLLFRLVPLQDVLLAQGLTLRTP